MSWHSGADHFSKSHRDDVRGECTELTLASIAAGSPALTARRAMGVRQSEFVRVHRPKGKAPKPTRTYCGAPFTPPLLAVVTVDQTN